MFGLVEQRRRVLVELDALDELGRDALQVLDDLVVDLLRVDRDLLDLRAEDVAHEAAREARLAVDRATARGRSASSA